mmetsp:Transcript_39622/g.118979  ORF Transcript_39622/g.118979 Transcript_39622/m.118979 type:complete len:566 (-) Transcript_39622:748-2445(-)
MQNRFTVRPVPLSVNLDALREYVEDRSTWVDRISFLPRNLAANADADAAVVPAVSASASARPQPLKNGAVVSDDADADADINGEGFCGDNDKDNDKDEQPSTGVLGIELSVENYRDDIVKWLNDHRKIDLEEYVGGGEGGDDPSSSAGEEEGDATTTRAMSTTSSLSSAAAPPGSPAPSPASSCFVVIDRASPMTKCESVAFLAGPRGPIPLGGADDDGGNAPPAADPPSSASDAKGRVCRYGPLRFRLMNPDGRDWTGCGGGTGSKLWRGGILLASAIEWGLAGGQFSSSSSSSRRSRPRSSQSVLSPETFRGRDVLELGAGCTGLPSLTLAAIAGAGASSPEERAAAVDGGIGAAASHPPPPPAPPRPRTLTVTDSIDESVSSLRETVEMNGLGDVASVEQLDFYDVPPIHLGRYDVIMHADAIYSLEQALKLAEACEVLLRQRGGDGNGNNGRNGNCGPTQGNGHTHAAPPADTEAPSCVLAMLPPFRVGVAEYIDVMGAMFGEPEEADLTDIIQARRHTMDDLGGNDDDNQEGGRGYWTTDVRCVQGGNGNGYRLLKWSVT